MSTRPTLPEELLLLSLGQRDRLPVARVNLDAALVAAGLDEALLQHRIDVSDGRLVPGAVDATGDSDLERLVQALPADGTGLRDMVERQARTVRSRYVERLVRRGVLAGLPGGPFGRLRQPRLRVTDPGLQPALRRRVRHALAAPDTDPRDRALAVLLTVADRLEAALGPVQADVRARLQAEVAAGPAGAAAADDAQTALFVALFA